MLDHLAPLPDTPTCALVTNAWACPRPELLADGYCVLHSPDPRKSVSDFTHLIIEQIANKDFDFQRCVFPAGYQLPAGDYVGADFSYAQFLGETALKGCRFIDEAYFNDATFSETLSLEGARFDGRASFLGTTFRRTLDARGVTLAGLATFESATFEFNCRFDGVMFPGAVSFSGATFGSFATFVGATFQGRCDFTSSTFKSESLFAGSTFHASADFAGVRHLDPTVSHDWTGCTFASVSFNESFVHTIDFSRSTFHSNLEFRASAVQGSLIFSGSTFLQDLVLFFSTLVDGIQADRSTFHGSIFVTNVHFGLMPGSPSILAFDQCELKEELSLFASSVSEFQFVASSVGSLQIIGTEALGSATFERSRINEKLLTEEARFRSTVDLRGLKLPAGHTFQAIRFEGSASFGGVDLDGITFRQMDLSNCRFANAVNIADAEFDNVTWARWPARGRALTFALVELLRQSTVTRWDFWAERQRHRREWSRIAIADELDARETGLDADERRQRLRAAERVYRGLRASHEDHKDHPRASDFYFAEMEMRRLAGSLNPLSPHFDVLTPLYALVSGYGEDWRRAASWFLALWVVWAALYLVVGLSVKSTVPNADGVLQVKLVDVGGPGWLSGCSRLACSLDPVGSALMHSLYVATFVGRDTYAVIRPGWGEMLQLIELLFGPVFLAFGALAIRRRFQR